MAPSSNPSTPTLCRNCQRRPADRPTRYHESIVDYSTRYVVGRGGYRARSVRKLVMDGTIQLCARCAARYQRSVALRSLGNRLATPPLVGLVLLGVLFAVVAYWVPAVTSGPLALVWLGAGLLVTAVFVVGVLLVVWGTILRGPATRFLRES